MTTSSPLSSPWTVGTSTVADRSPFRPKAAVVEAARSIETLAIVAGGFVIDWKLGGLTGEQQ